MGKKNMYALSMEQRLNINSSQAERNDKSLLHVCYIEGDNIACYVTANLGLSRAVTGDTVCSQEVTMLSQ